MTFSAVKPCEKRGLSAHHSHDTTPLMGGLRKHMKYGLHSRSGTSKAVLFASVLALIIATVPSVQPAIGQQEDPLAEPLASPRKAVPVAPTANDVQIADRISGILRSTGWFDAPRVSVAQGVVFIDGRTTSPERKTWAGALAENTQDVVAVVNRLEVATDVESTLAHAANEFIAIYWQTVRSWPLVLVAAIVLLVIWAVARLAMAATRRYLVYRVSSPLLRSVLARAVSIPIYVLGIYFILQIAGLTRLALTILGGTGILGIIIGFAFRDIAENFLASLLLSVRNPFRSGDLVEIGGHTGVVQNLNTRSTVLLTLNGTHIQIPNAMVYKSTITNFSSNPTRSASFVIGIGYDASVAKAQSLILNVLREHPAVKEMPAPLVLLEELGAATMNLRASYWFDSAIHAPVRMNSALLRQSKNALVDAGISLPDTAREVIFPSGVAVTVLQDVSSDERSDRETDIGPAQDLRHADSSNSTDGEGDLSSEVTVLTQTPQGAVPEARENLLK